jgi:hypothetical protein
MSKPKFKVGQFVRYGADLLWIRKVHHGHFHAVRFMAALTAQLTSVEMKDKHVRHLTAREIGPRPKRRPKGKRA